MQTPKNWYWPIPDLGARLLTPLAHLYGWAARRRISRSPRYHARVPVICVGNLSVGGTGKTPVCLSIAARLKALGRIPVFLSRGYGGYLKGPVQVDPDDHHFREVGDEPLLLASEHQCWVARDRVLGAQAIEAAILETQGAEALKRTVIIMDDGFQNPDLFKNISLLVVDGKRGFGNHMLLPAGPLREQVGDGLARAQGVAIIGPDNYSVAARTRLLPTFHGAVEVTNRAFSPGERVVGFAGIGDPRKFRATLEKMGAEIREFMAFPDHHPFDINDLRILRTRANGEGARLVTTEKDLVRFPRAARESILAVPIRIRWEDEGLIDAFLQQLETTASPHQ